MEEEENGEESGIDERGSHVTMDADVECFDWTLLTCALWAH